MMQPVEMRKALPMTLHGGAISTTTEVWEMLNASRDGDLDRVTALISRRPELSTCQYNSTPPLHFAVREGHLPVVRALVERGALDPEYRTYPFKDSLVTMAQDRDHHEIVDLLQRAATTPGLTHKWVDIGVIDYGQDESERRFDKALHGDDLKKAQSLLADRPDLACNELSSWAEGVLMMPAKKRNFPMLELLVDSGAQVPALSKWGRFYYFQHEDVAAWLLEHRMSASHMSWQHVTLLHDVAQAGEIEKARLLLAHGADINAVDEEYRSTPLGMAARWGQKAMVTFLLEQGADPNKAGAAWSTPLAWARKKGHADIARDLSASGAVEN